MNEDSKQPSQDGSIKSKNLSLEFALTEIFNFYALKYTDKPANFDDMKS